MYGIGTKSCAYWQSSGATLAEGRAWAYGYWSGLNTFNNQDHMVGSRTDSDGIIGEVKKLCDSHPSITFGTAVLAVYGAMMEGK